MSKLSNFEQTKFGLYNHLKKMCSSTSPSTRGGQFNCLAKLIGQFGSILIELLSKLRSVRDKLVKTDYPNYIQLTFLFMNCLFELLSVHIKLPNWSSNWCQFRTSNTENSLCSRQTWYITLLKSVIRVYKEDKEQFFLIILS